MFNNNEVDVLMINQSGSTGASAHAIVTPKVPSEQVKQRVMIAMAIARNPLLLIADEPTTALDVTTQAQVLNLLYDLNQQFNMAILMITHDLGIVSQMAQKIAKGVVEGHVAELTNSRIVQQVAKRAPVIAIGFLLKTDHIGGHGDDAMLA